MMHLDAFFYVLPFLYSVFISVVISYGCIVLYKKLKLHDRRSGQRHIHKKNISRFGGVAIVTAFIVSLYINTALVFDDALWAIVIGSSAILFFGILDDLRPVSWKSQMFFQIALVLLTFICGVQISYISNPFGGVFWLITDNMPFFSILFMMVWMMFIMNAINWCDGIDGLASGVVLIAAITLFIIALEPQVMQPPIAIMSIILAGSVLGFLFFNFPPANIFAGSSGSFFMGYVIAILAIVAGAKIGATLLVLAVPLIDAVWVIINRMRRGSSIFNGDREHLHHRLLDLGWSVRKVLFLYYGVTIFCAIAAVMTQSINKLLVFVFLSIGIILFFILLSYERQEARVA